MDAVGVAAAVHEPAGELVDDDDFALFDDVLLILVEQVPRLERGVQLMRQFEIPLVVEVLDAQHLLDFGDAFLGDRRGVRLLVDREVFVFDQARHDLGKLAVEVGRVLTLPADDERGARFVDEDRIDFVDDREVQLALHHVFELPGHVVAQVVEADFVIRDVGDVAVVRRAPLDRRKVVLDDAHAHAQEVVQRRHPLGVAAGQIVVDRDHVHALTEQRVGVGGQGRDERLTLARLHLGDLAFVQHHAAHDLNVEMAHLHDALAGLAADRENFGQHVVERFAVGDALPELGRSPVRGRSWRRRSGGAGSLRAR